MPQTTTEKTQTLGQRIDALLAPLYAEAEQHRKTLNDAREQIKKLEEWIAKAERGLGQIESRMVQVLRAFANDEPVLAAAITGEAETGTEPGPQAAAAIAADSDTVTEAGPDIHAATDPTTVTETTDEVDTAGPVVDEAEAAAPQPPGALGEDEDAAITAMLEEGPGFAASQLAAATAEDLKQGEPAATKAPAPDEAGPEATVPLDLDPEEDRRMVEEAAALLASEPGSAEVSGTVDAEVDAAPTAPPTVSAATPAPGQAPATTPATPTKPAAPAMPTTPTGSATSAKPAASSGSGAVPANIAAVAERAAMAARQLRDQAGGDAS